MRFLINTCDILAAVLILAAWIHESRKLPRLFVWQMSLRYIRFFLIYALMMNRYNRYAQWSEGIAYSSAAIPYWPLTRAETGVLIVYAVTGVIGLVIYFRNRNRRKTGEDEFDYIPFSPGVFFYPLTMPGLKIAKKRTSVTAVACLTTMIWFMGLLNILITTLFSMKNVR